MRKISTEFYFKGLIWIALLQVKPKTHKRKANIKAQCGLKQILRVQNLLWMNENSTGVIFRGPLERLGGIEQAQKETRKGQVNRCREARRPGEEKWRSSHKTKDYTTAIKTLRGRSNGEEEQEQKTAIHNLTVTIYGKLNHHRNYKKQIIPSIFPPRQIKNNLFDTSDVIASPLRISFKFTWSGMNFTWEKQPPGMKGRTSTNCTCRNVLLTDMETQKEREKGSILYIMALQKGGKASPLGVRKRKPGKSNGKSKSFWLRLSSTKPNKKKKIPGRHAKSKLDNSTSHLFKLRCSGLVLSKYRKLYKSTGNWEAHDFPSTVWRQSLLTVSTDFLFSNE